MNGLSGSILSGLQASRPPLPIPVPASAAAVVPGTSFRFQPLGVNAASFSLCKEEHPAGQVCQNCSLFATTKTVYETPKRSQAAIVRIAGRLPLTLENERRPIIPDDDLKQLKLDVVGLPELMQSGLPSAFEVCQSVFRRSILAAPSVADVQRGVQKRFLVAPPPRQGEDISTAATQCLRLAGDAAPDALKKLLIECVSFVPYSSPIANCIDFFFLPMDEKVWSAQQRGYGSIEPPPAYTFDLYEQIGGGFQYDRRVVFAFTIPTPEGRKSSLAKSGSIVVFVGGVRVEVRVDEEGDDGSAQSSSSGKISDISKHAKRDRAAVEWEEADGPPAQFVSPPQSLSRDTTEQSSSGSSSSPSLAVTRGRQIEWRDLSEFLEPDQSGPVKGGNPFSAFTNVISKQSISTRFVVAACLCVLEDQVGTPNAIYQVAPKLFAIEEDKDWRRCMRHVLQHNSIHTDESGNWVTVKGTEPTEKHFLRKLPPEEKPNSKRRRRLPPGKQPSHERDARYTFANNVRVGIPPRWHEYFKARLGNVVEKLFLASGTDQAVQ